MSKINLILLVAFVVIACTAALPVPSDEIVEAVDVIDEVPVAAEMMNDEATQEDSAKVFRRPVSPLLNPYLNTNLGATNVGATNLGATNLGITNLNSPLYAASVITKAPLSVDATLLLQQIGKK